MQSTEEIRDLNRRMSKIFQNSNLSISIGEVAKKADVSPSKIRYWEKSGYIHSDRASKNKDHKYSQPTLLKVQLIKSYLDSGFTLSMAAKKASVMDRFHNLLAKTVQNRLMEFNIVDGKPALNFGKINDHQNVWFIIDKNDVKTKLIDIKK